MAHKKMNYTDIRFKKNISLRYFITNLSFWGTVTVPGSYNIFYRFLSKTTKLNKVIY